MGEGKHSVAIVGAGPDEEVTIRGQIEDLVEIVAVEPDPLEVHNVIADKSPNVVLLYLDDNPEMILSSTKNISQSNGCLAIIVSKNRDPDNILLAMRSGARDFAFLDQESNDIRRAITDLGTRTEQIESGGLGKVITVFSAKGGSGATTIASNLAGALLTYGKGKGEAKRKVALLDFDLEMGDVLVFLDLELRFGYLELLNNIYRLDSELLQQSLAIHSSGLCVVSQTDKVEESGDVGAEELTKIISFLRRHFDYIVIDGLRDFREIALSALDTADNIIVTMTPDIPALKNANRCLRLFKRLGYNDGKVKLVLNRYRTSRKLSRDSIADALGKPIDGTVANSFPTVIKSINQGSLLVQDSPGSRVAKDIKGLVPMFVEDAPAKKRGLFSWGR